jgi:hypothetical protein
MGELGFRGRDAAAGPPVSGPAAPGSASQIALHKTCISALRFCTDPACSAAHHVEHGCFSNCPRDLVVRDPLRAYLRDRPGLTMVIASISGADIFGLVASVLVCAYLLYALLRGEKL